MTSLNPAQTLRLFKNWGFTPEPSNGSSRGTGGHVWLRHPTHPDQRVAVAARGRQHGTTDESYRTGAKIMGVPVREFMQGPGPKLGSVGVALKLALSSDLSSASSPSDPIAYISQEEIVTMPMPVPTIVPTTALSAARADPPGSMVVQYGRDLLDVLRIAERPQSSNLLRAVTDLDKLPYSAFEAAVEWVNSEAVRFWGGPTDNYTILFDWRRSKSAMAFKVFYVQGTAADAPWVKAQKKAAIVTPAAPKLKPTPVPASPAPAAPAAPAVILRAPFPIRRAQILDLFALEGKPLTAFEVGQKLQVSVQSAAGYLYRMSIETGPSRLYLRMATTTELDRHGPGPGVKLYSTTQPVATRTRSSVHRSDDYRLQWGQKAEEQQEPVQQEQPKPVPVQVQEPEPVPVTAGPATVTVTLTLIGKLDDNTLLVRDAKGVLCTLKPVTL